MKSKTSLFNWSISKNLLKRYWPMWLAYLVLMIIVLPVDVAQFDYNNSSYYYYYESIEVRALSSAFEFWIPALASVIAAMAMYGYLYQNRSCGMMAALPVKRESMFITAFLTGIVPLLLVNVLTVLITACLGIVKFNYLLLWLAISCMNIIAFYGMAAFCAMLTGNIIVLPAVYIVLNLAAFVAGSCVAEILRYFVFGMTNAFNFKFIAAFSPIMWLYEKSHVFYDAGIPNEVVIKGLGWVGFYCVIGIILAVSALLLYKRRNMETAGDTVAVAVLKPVFKYCMCFGTALVTGALGMGLFNFRFNGGITTALAALGFMLLGAFVGFFAAEMMMKKSLRVFKTGWTGLFISFALIAVFVFSFEFDLFGYEKNVPDAEEVEIVCINGTDLEEKENIELMTELHQQIIDSKAQYEGRSDGNTMYLNLDYQLSGGRYISRQYNIESSSELANDPDSEISKFHEIINSTEAINRRKQTSIPVEEQYITYAYISASYPMNDYGNMPAIEADASKPTTFYLSPQQAVELYNECIVPDIEDGTIGRIYYADSDEYLDSATNISIDIQLEDRTELNEDGQRIEKPVAAHYFNITLTLDAERTLKWILDNTDFEPISERQFQMEVQELNPQG